MATAKKLPSGRWRCLIYDYTDESDKRHYKSFTADTKKQAEFLATQYKLEESSMLELDKLTLKQAFERYCDSKSNVLSQSTLKEYRRLAKNAYNDLINKSINKINAEMLQKWTNSYALNHSPKSTRNAYGFLSAVFKTYRPQFQISITMPQSVKTYTYVPTDSDVKSLISYFSETDKDMLLAIYLAAYGTLRRSEIAALTAADVKDNTISVNKAMIDAGKSNWIVKTTKTKSSTRKVIMPDFVIEQLPAAGKLINLNPTQIYSRFKHALKCLDIPDFRFHDLRHYAASIMHALGIPDVYIMQRGGWSSDRTLKQIYRGAMEDYTEKFNATILEHLDSMQHEMQHKKKKT